MKKAINFFAAIVYYLAVTTPCAGFTRFLFYEPEIPKCLKTSTTYQKD
ncbi:cyclic lactone autoinducer peptide [Anaeromicropila populeti]|uniref:Uncharacterized protein n=1 Tax=Anaeromicropila populeti TaxID=37658 RepID=A0A1I6K9L8_9FIRM|nr:cyclic lactone autoinducer peptide [Anaeromicropila populeti]SFR87896.1 hypothetical protein SAMN05661086_02302 [Anaeromicropila populeti]